jgi:hypothetical protein
VCSVQLGRSQGRGLCRFCGRQRECKWSLGRCQSLSHRTIQGSEGNGEDERCEGQQDYGMFSREGVGHRQLIKLFWDLAVVDHLVYLAFLGWGDKVYPASGEPEPLSALPDM